MAVVTQMRDVLKMFTDGWDSICIITGTKISLSTFIVTTIRPVYRMVAVLSSIIIVVLTLIKVALTIHW